MSTRAARVPKGFKALLRDRKTRDIPTWLKILNWKEKQQRERWYEDGVPFPVGQKKIYLPKFSLTFVNTPLLASKWAQFIVPTWFNKLDLRDYLWHVYGEKVLTIRSYITPQPLSQVAPVDHARRPYKFAHYRPSMIKKMTVELVRPFVWPAPPRDYSPWEQERYDEVLTGQFGREMVANARAEMRMRQKEEAGKRAKERKELMKRQGPQRPRRYAELLSSEDMRTYGAERAWLAVRAKQYLDGKAQWGQSTPNTASVPDVRAVPGEQTLPGELLTRDQTIGKASIFNTPRTERVRPPQGPP